MSNTEKKHIVIVGAGISGLTCARELSKYSDQLNITVLEGSHRIGGRIFTKSADDGTKLELGAHYIHGTKNNPIYDYAMQKGLLEERDKKDWIPFKVMHCFNKELNEKSLGKKTEALDVGIKFSSDVLEHFFDVPIESLCSNYTSVGDYVHKCFQSKLNEYSLDGDFQEILRSVFMYTINEEAATNGCRSLYELDIQGYYDYIDLTGDLHCFMDNNDYSKIVEEIQKEILVDCIKLNHEVTKVEQSRDVSKEVNQSNIRITCSNGNVFYADVVVLTVSIEVLKEFLLHDKLQISHAQHKLQSMNGLCLGRVVKVYFKFTEPISSNYHFIRLYPSPDNFDNEIYDRYSQICALDRVPGTDYWLVWLLGDLVEDFQTKEPTIFIKEMLEAFKGMYPDFPSTDFDYESITFHDWVKDHFYRGSYSYLKVGSSSADILKLQEPLMCNDCFVLFAGEMTDPCFYSTTHGAYNSGIREANRILQICNLNISS